MEGISLERIRNSNAVFIIIILTRALKFGELVGGRYVTVSKKKIKKTIIEYKTDYLFLVINDQDTKNICY